MTRSDVDLLVVSNSNDGKARAPVRKIDSASIYDPLSVRIGRVDELFLDPFGGRLRFALASFDIPEIEGESLPLPWASTTMRLREAFSAT
jgi:hypothetical protein